MGAFKPSLYLRHLEIICPRAYALQKSMTFRHNNFYKIVIIFMETMLP